MKIGVWDDKRLFGFVWKIVVSVGISGEELKIWCLVLGFGYGLGWC